MSGLTGTFQKLLGKKVIIRDVSKGTTVGVVKKVSPGVVEIKIPCTKNKRYINMNQIIWVEKFCG